MKFIDLTHTFKKGIPIFPGDPKPKLEQIAFLDKDHFNDFQITSTMHVGTHIDAPSHILKDGKQLGDYPIDYFFGKAHLVDARNKAISVDLLKDKQILKGDIVLIWTGFSEKFETSEYHESYPEISEAFALKMVELGVKLIGIDTPSPDRAPYLIHKLLLKNGILIIENLTNLESLSEYHEFNLVALPMKLSTDSAPARVVAQI